MAEWKKVVVSGSSAELGNLKVSGLAASQVVIGGGSAGNLTTTAINGTGNIVATTGASGLVHSGSFSGSFSGDGSGLTGIGTNAKFLVYQTGSGANSIKGISDGTNVASGAATVVGGGVSNQATGACSTIGGGKSNITTNSGGYGTVGGGTQNEALGQWAPTVAGGFNNCVNASYGSILGGLSNNVTGGQAAVVGGGSNNAGGVNSIAGGNTNTTTGDNSQAIGGQGNSATANHASVTGGHNNLASGACATIGGGQLNTGSAAHSTVGGGCSNVASGTCSTVAGGKNNSSTTNLSFIGGGEDNCTIGTSTTANIGGGFGNTINNGACSTIGGGCGNSVTSNFSTISGGYGGTVSGIYGTVSGGYENQATAGCTAVVGGCGNVASAASSGILSGESNTASGTCSGILGGVNNTANAAKSFIVGSDISSTVANHTHVNNLSTLGNITASAGTVSASAFIGDGSGLTGISSNTDVKDVYFVTPNGTDATAQRGNLIKPYKTITAARSASVAAGNNSGSLVYVYPGEYRENSLNEGYAGSFYFAPEVQLIYSQSDGTSAPMFGAGFGAFPESIQVYGDASITSTDGDMLKMETSGAGYFECFDIKTSNNQIVYMENDADLVFKADEIRISSPTYGFTIRDTAKFTLDAKVLDFTGTGGASFCFFPRPGDSSAWSGEIDVNINKWILRDGFGVLQQNANGSRNVYNIDNFVLTESAGWGLAFQSRNGTSDVSYVNFTSNIHSQNGARVIEDISGTGVQEIILNGSIVYESGSINPVNVNGGASTDITFNMNVESSGSTEVISHSNGDLILGSTIVNKSGDGVKTTGGKLFINNLNISASGDSVTSTSARTVTINNSLSSNVAANSNITFDGPGASLSPVSGRIIITDLSSSATSTSSFGTYRGGDNNTFGSTTLSSAAVSDLTAGRVVLAGVGGELQDNNNLTFDPLGNILGVSGAITNASTVAATKLTGSFSGSFVGDGSGLTGIASTLTVDGDSGTQNVDLTADDLQFLGTAGEITTAITKVGTDVKVSSSLATTITKNRTFSGDVITFNNDIRVLGTASFDSTQNLKVADRFIALASGSGGAGDGGIVIEQSNAGGGKGQVFGFDNANGGRWGLLSGFNPTASAFTPTDLMVTSTKSTSAPVSAPTYGGATGGTGNIHVKTDTGDIYIYA